jgi:formylglycine-generating enzyme required for sulfatase activity
VLTGEIDQKLPPDLPSADEKREKLAKRQANAAVALLRMNQPEKVWPLFKHSPDPRVRSYLVDRLRPFGADARSIVKRLEDEPDLTIRRALLLSLGEYGEKVVSPDDRKALLPKSQEMYRTATDPGLHAACEWLLRQWQQEAWLKQVNDEWAKDKGQRKNRLEDIKRRLPGRAASAPGVPPQWYVNSQGQTMVVIPDPMEFMMGSPTTEVDRYDSERQHKVRIGRTFAIAAKSVTWGQYLEFNPAYKDERDNRFSPSLTCQVNYISWNMAAQYCNWLSKKEELSEDQWCYEIEGQVTKLRENYLSLAGYRLPTEAEMEYATRAGALTSRYYGETEELLPQYAWFDKNSKQMTWPVGNLKPNDLGLFDSHGNVFTWCQDSYKPYPQGQEASNDKEDEVAITSTRTRVLRGGSFDNQASNVRSANRVHNTATRTNHNLGFRLARTFR